MLTTTAAATGNTTTTATRNNSGGLSTNQPIQLSDLQKYLSNLTQSPDTPMTAPPNGKNKFHYFQYRRQPS